VNRLEKVDPLTQFRTKLFIGMVLVVVILTALGIFLSQREISNEAARGSQKDFQNQLADLHRIQDLRNAALTERCRDLAQRPRIHAALEDNALDILYPSAQDELQEVMNGENGAKVASTQSPLKAEFYRFLNSSGRVISPSGAIATGQLPPADEARLSLGHIPATQQFGYLVRSGSNSRTSVDEIIAVPIVSTETGDLIAALVLGFEPNFAGISGVTGMMQGGIFADGHLEIPGLAAEANAQLANALLQITASPKQLGTSVSLDILGKPHLLFCEQINPGSLYAPAYEVVLYPLARSLERERQLKWQVALAGILLLVGGVLASYFLAARFSRPVEKLEVDSKENQAQRQRAEVALKMTNAELQRAARFSADASHQLKTPLTVLRSGLEEIVTRTDVPSDVREEAAALVHQTFRLASIVEDLLLLSRMEAGRLQISFGPVDVMEIIDALVDDLTALPDPLEVQIEKSGPTLTVAGEKRYIALIMQNLFENARKYNCPGGKIRVDCREDGEFVAIVIGNTGRPIIGAARENIFERFHRGTAGENIPGHGLGLNLARELALLHGGDVRLKRSEENWTEFEARFQSYRST
jgi:signal transduction histidine kinase